MGTPAKTSPSTSDPVALENASQLAAYDVVVKGELVTFLTIALPEA